MPVHWGFTGSTLPIFHCTVVRLHCESKAGVETVARQRLVSEPRAQTRPSYAVCEPPTPVQGVWIRGRATRERDGTGPVLECVERREDETKV